jgi:hypothetical protein
MHRERHLVAIFADFRKNTGLKMQPKSHHHQKDRNKQTLGFPPVNPAQPKRVIFSTPLCARCVSADGLRSANCLVLCVWDTGARLQVSLPGDLTEFQLLFTSSQKPVSRQCRRVSTWGNVIEVAYLRKQPTFVLNAGLDS